jgi:hypothetical protein
MSEDKAPMCSVVITERETGRKFMGEDSTPKKALFVALAEVFTTRLNEGALKKVGALAQAR